MELLLEGVEECHLQQVTLDHNSNPNLPRLLSGPRFTQLTTLSLSGNGIRSIEPLQHIDTSHLKLLLLNMNHLTSIRPFKKMNLRSL